MGSFNRLSVIIAFPSKSQGGCEEYALTLARSIDQQGFGVHALFPLSKGTQSLRESFSAFELSYTPLILRYWLPGRFRRVRFAWDIFMIVLCILKKNPRSVHISLPWPDTATELLLACALLRVRTVVTFQLVGEKFTLSPKLRRWYLWARSRNQEWVAVSENNRIILSNVFGISIQEIHLVYNGVTLPKPTITSSQISEITGYTPFILTVGRLSYQKGFDVLLRAFANIQPMFSSIKLVIVGDGELLEELVRQAIQLNLADRVVFTGKRLDVPNWLYNAKLFVLPSRSEGQSFALLEAMAAGVPIVASSASSIPDVVVHEKEGIIFEKDNVLDLTQKLIWALMHMNEMNILAANAKEKAGQFSREAMLRQTLQLLGITFHNEPDPRP